MTVGKDVSALFADVVNCIQTDNIELKKLVYLYVMNYAKAQPELAILAINTFRKDASDSNPLIRSLAVRTMGCIRLDQVTEYLLEPLRKCCQDPDPYVRKTSAICIPKVYDINPELVEDQGFIEILKDMLSDGNPMVVANAVAGLAEISEACGKDLLDLHVKATVTKLTAALNECNEWGQVFILDALSSYVPACGPDADFITERVTARLSHVNPAVVLAAIKVILKCMEYVDNTEAVRMLAKKLNPPLVTLLSSEPETQYVSLRNIRLIVQKRPGILANDVKMFFCKYNDPVYLKLEKVDIMVMLVTEKNFEQVLLELKDYSTGVDVDFVRKSVRSIGRVAVKLERACERAISVLLELIETKVNYVVQEASVVVKDIFRKYPSRYEQVLSALCDSLEVLDEPEAKASMIWILGEYAERIDNADELLDNFLTNFHDEPLMVQMQLLTAIVKLFLKKPQSTQDMVTKVLTSATEESNNHDIRDRGYIYWRLLSTNPEGAKQVVLGDKPSIRDDSQTIERGLLDRLISDLALMSSVYHKSAEDFVTRIATGAPQAADDGNVEDEEYDEEDRQARRREVQQEMERGPEDDDRRANGSSGGGGGGGGLDLLDLDGGSDDAISSSGPAQPQKQPVLSPQTPGKGQQRTGFGVMACVARKNGQPQLMMTFQNSSQVPMSGFALQINKNPFGLAPATQLQAPDLAPGTTCEVVTPLVPGQNPNNQPPTNPLVLMVAIKNSLDVFYFNVGMDLTALLVEGAALSRDGFTEVWQRVGEARESRMQVNSERPLTADAVRSRLALDNVQYVAQRQVDDQTVLIYTSATTTNNIVILGSVTVSSASTSITVSTRTETPVLTPLFEALVKQRLGAR
uniref:Beta-adaptin appendage C-terminal subdomain domain-containing protein n=1 Tax=Alexandrium catenella TaxID=2925 RepID=A0A7S1PK62_ALECA